MLYRLLSNATTGMSLVEIILFVGLCGMIFVCKVLMMLMRMLMLMLMLMLMRMTLEVI
jgi:hypothetical protein